MFDKWRKYSYAAQKSQRHRILRIVLGSFLFFFIYLFLSSFVFFMAGLENDDMQPSLLRGDRLIFSSYKIYSFSPPGPPKLRRGSIVMVDLSLRKDRSILVDILDEILRFWTAQRISFPGRGSQLYLKRVIGLPGDEISMTNFVIRVRPEGSSHSLTEFELSEEVYDVDIPQLPALWDQSLPFSGDLEPLILPEDQCFVLSDDRSNTNDSRSWGPIPTDIIAGRALFRYWPLNRLGRP
jgi:signal peptidase I